MTEAREAEAPNESAPPFLVGVASERLRLARVNLELATAGESHGPALVAILAGLPAGLVLDREAIDADLRRRQQGYGRSRRQQIETDEVEVLAGLRRVPIPPQSTQPERIATRSAASSRCARPAFRPVSARTCARRSASTPASRPR